MQPRIHLQPLLDKATILENFGLKNDIVRQASPEPDKSTMASLYKLQQDKGSRKRSAEAIDEEGQTESSSGFRAIKQKILILSSRGITARQRFLMNDLTALLPHSKKDTKLDTKSKLYQLNEVAELYNCNNIMFFESRKHQDLYMWLARAPNGPSFKLHLQNLHTMDELNLTGNCLKGSRPILSFDQSFDAKPHLRLLKELMTQTFGVPKGVRRSKPFVDHIVTLTIVDNKIWFRNYQINQVEVDPTENTPAPDGEIKTQKKAKKGETKIELIEIGPRFCMTMICILEGSFGGPLIYENKEFVSPNQVRRLAKLGKAEKYKGRQVQDGETKAKKEKYKPRKSELDNDVLFK